MTVPRNRKKRPLAEPIAAHVDGHGVLSCGRCRQRFPFVFQGRMAEHVMARGADGFETWPQGGGVKMRVRYGAQAAAWLEVMIDTAWGWRHDGHTWRPTTEDRVRRERTRLLNVRSWARVARDRERRTNACTPLILC